MLRSLTARPRAAAATSPARAGLPLPLILDLVRLLVLLVVLITVPLAEPDLGTSAQGTAIAVALGVSAASWVVWMLARNREPVIVATLAVMGAAGGALAGLSPLSTAIAVGCLVTSSAGARLETEKSLAITAETVAAFLIAGLATGAPAESLLGYPLTFIGLWAFGLTRHAYVLRAEQAERMLAREIHDVLAHSLPAVSVNLEAAEGLLGALPAGSQELAKAIECVGRAGAFTRERGGRSWHCATTRLRWPISCPAWPMSTAPAVTWPSTSPSRARQGRSRPRRAWPPTGPRRRP